jgi:hypothetical protein
MDIDTQEEYYDIDENGTETRMSHEYDLFESYFSELMDDPDKFVEDALAAATDEEYDAIAKAYVGQFVIQAPVTYQGTSPVTLTHTADREGLDPTVQASSRTMTGGAKAKNVEDAAHDYFSLVDSLHDFNDIPYEGRASNSAKIAIADIRSALGDPVLPAGMEDIDDSRCPTRFSTKITALKEFRFGPDMVMPNPLHGLDLNDDHEIPVTKVTKGRITHAVTSESYDSVVTDQKRFTETKYANRITPLSVVCKYRDKKKVLELEQIAAVCCAMKYKYGYHATFIVDNSDEHLLKLFTATLQIDEKFLEKFTLSPRTDYVKKLKHTMGPVWWDIALCDANMLDAENGGTFVRTQATGDVFRKGASARITLGGVAKTEDTFKLSVDGSAFIDKTIPFLDGSKAFVRGSCIGKTPLEMAPFLATKRAADYGQIQHCLKYAAIENKTFVFVSNDVLAAYFGMFKGVPLMQMRTRSYSDAKFNHVFCKLNVNLFKREPVMPTFRALVQVAGGEGMWSAACALFAVVLAMAALA